MSRQIQETYTISDDDTGKRVDQVATRVFEEYSRSRIQSWIKSEEITLNGEPCRSRDKVFSGDEIVLNATLEEEERWKAQDIDISAVYEDSHIIVVNKPAGLVVHPGAGIGEGTLLNGLLHHYPEVAMLPRAGIVHRLDKDTSGLMVVARSLEAHTSLIKQLQDRSLGREYEAVVMGELTGGGMVDKPMGRHPTQRIKMAVHEASSSSAKEAITHYRLIKRFSGYTHIACQLETGRTHQIRVHMAWLKHPIVGDPLYLGRQKWVAGTASGLKTVLQGFNRQALHARRLTLIHPESGEELMWEAELPQDMVQLLTAMEASCV